MADNFLERQQADYERAKKARSEVARRAWQKRLKAYQESLRRQQEDEKAEGKGQA